MVSTIINIENSSKIKVEMLSYILNYIHGIN